MGHLAFLIWENRKVDTKLRVHFVLIAQQLDRDCATNKALSLTLLLDKRMSGSRNHPPKGVLGKSRHIRRRADIT
jgi:hypothetical protein